MNTVDDIAIGLGRALQQREAANEQKLEKVAKRAGWAYALVVAVIGALVWAFSAGVVYGNVATKADLAAERVALTTAVDKLNATASEMSTRLTRIEVKLDGMTVVMQPAPLKAPKP